MGFFNRDKLIIMIGKRLINLWLIMLFACAINNLALPNFVLLQYSIINSIYLILLEQKFVTFTLKKTSK